MKLFLVFLLISGFFLTPCFAAEREGIKMSNAQNIPFSKWKDLWSDGFELHFVTLPDFVAEKEIYKIKEKKGGDLTISNKAISPDRSLVAFAADTLVGNTRRNTLYLFDGRAGNTAEIGYCLSPLSIVNLRGFLGNDRLLLEGYGKVEAGQLLYSDKGPGNYGYFFIYDIKGKHIDILNDLGPTTVGMANATCAGDVLAYGTGDGFIIYNVATKNKKEIKISGDLIAISPDGQNILFRRGGMTGDYYLIETAGTGEKLLLTEKKMKSLLWSSGSYRDLVFASWSPDSKFILFSESSDINRQKMFIVDIATKEIESVH